MDHPPKTGFERYIVDVVRGRDKSTAAELPEILDSIDAREKWVPTRGELNTMLEGLVADGSIAEVPGHRYIDPSTGSGSSRFTPITDTEMAAALEAYDRDFWQRFEDLRNGALSDRPLWPKLSATWLIQSVRRPTDSDLEPLTEAAARMVEALEASGIETTLGGFSLGPGTVDFPVLAHREADAERMLAVTRPIYAAAAPAGSRLWINEWDPWAALAKIPMPFDTDTTPG